MSICFKSNANEASQAPGRSMESCASPPLDAGHSRVLRKSFRLVLVAVATLAVLMSIELALVQGDPIIACLLFGWVAERNI